MRRLGQGDGARRHRPRDGSSPRPPPRTGSRRRSRRPTGADRRCARRRRRRPRMPFRRRRALCATSATRWRARSGRAIGSDALPPRARRARRAFIACSGANGPRVSSADRRRPRRTWPSPSWSCRRGSAGPRAGGERANERGAPRGRTRRCAEGGATRRDACSHASALARHCRRARGAPARTRWTRRALSTADASARRSCRTSDARHGRRCSPRASHETAPPAARVVNPAPRAASLFAAMAWGKTVRGGVLGGAPQGERLRVGTAGRSPRALVASARPRRRAREARRGAPIARMVVGRTRPVTRWTKSRRPALFAEALAVPPCSWRSPVHRRRRVRRGAPASSPSPPASPRPPRARALDLEHKGVGDAGASALGAALAARSGAGPPPRSQPRAQPRDDPGS